MDVLIKKFAVAMEVKNAGVEFQVNDVGAGQRGDLIVAKGGLTWCPGRTTPANGLKATWEEFIEWMASK